MTYRFLPYSHLASRNTIILLIIALLLHTMCSTSVFADEVKITPKILGRVTWYDNLFLEGINDTELRTDPQLDVAYHQEKLTLNLNGRLSDFKYLNESGYDRTVYSSSLDASYLLSERLSLNAGGQWTQDYSVDSYWDVNTNDMNILFRQRVRHNAYLSGSYKLTERDTVDLHGGYSNMKYDKRTPGYSNYDMYSANLTWQRLLNDRTLSLVSQASWQYIDFDSPAKQMFWGLITSKEDITQNVFSALAGLYWFPSEQLTVKAMAGANHTRSEIITTQTGIINSESERKSNNTGFTGRLDIDWKNEYDSLRFHVHQEYLPSTFGELRIVSNANITGTRRFSNKFRGGGEVGYTKVESNNVSNNNNISREYWLFNTNCIYSITEDFALRLDYMYVNYRNKVTNNIKNSNTVFLQLTYQFPMSF